MSFTDLHLKYEGYDPKNWIAQWTVTVPLSYTGNDGRVITVPVGFLTDLASVPRIPLIYSQLGNRGEAIRPAVLHDYLCREKIIPRAEADLLFHETLLEEGMNEADAKSYLWAVQLYSNSLKRNEE